ELFQEFGLRLVRGDFRRADPERGRFRDYVKTTLFHLIVDYQNRRQGQPLPTDVPGQAAPPGQALLEQEFKERWAQGLLERAWEGLAEVERATGQPCYSVLRFRAENPGVRSPEMAERLTQALRPEKAFTDANIRKVLQRAREKFADLLLDEVARSL